MLVRGGRSQVHDIRVAFASVAGGGDTLIARIAAFLQRSSADLASHLHIGCCACPWPCCPTQVNLYGSPGQRSCAVARHPSAALLHCRAGFSDGAEEPNGPARIAAQTIIDATERMQAAEQEATRLAGLLADSLQVDESFAILGPRLAHERALASHNIFA